MNKKLILCVVIFGFASIAAIPSNYYKSFYSIIYKNKLAKEISKEAGYPYRIIEGKSGVLSVYSNGDFELSGTKFTGGAIEGGWAELAYAPRMLLGRPIHRVLVIGAGHGDLAMLFNTLPENPWVDVAELSEELVAAQQDNSIAKRPIGSAYFRGDYGMHIHVIDGRRWVNEALASGIKYDIIQIGINMPSSGTSGNLYTKEFFHKISRILADDGVAMVYSFTSALKTASEVFPYLYIVGGVPNVGGLEGEFFAMKRPARDLVWDYSYIKEIEKIGDTRAKAINSIGPIAIGSHPDTIPTVFEVDPALYSKFELNDDDRVIITFNKFWRKRNPTQISPSVRLWLHMIDPNMLRNIGPVKTPNESLMNTPRS